MFASKCGSQEADADHRRPMKDKMRVIGSTGGALGLGAFAAAAATCCGVPRTVALVGVSGAVALARLSFLMPYALLGAGGLLAIAFWWVYRPPCRLCRWNVRYPP
jgi:hypothetical protein